MVPQKSRASHPQDLDELMELMGPFGRWQISILSVLAFVMFFQSMINLSNIFYAYTPTHYCKIPQIEDMSPQVLRYEDLKNLSYPQRHDGEGPQSCSMYDAVDYGAFNASGGTNTPLGQILQTINDTIQTRGNGTRNCSDGWHYEDDVMRQTTITDFGLICGEDVKIAHTHSVYMIGFFVGSLIAGPLADYIGRKIAFLFFGIDACIFSIAISFAPNYTVYLVLRFFMAIGNVGGWLVCFVLLQEITSARYRSWVGGLFWLPYALGYTCLSGFAYFLRDWRTLNLVMSVPLVGYIAMIWIIPESFRWLLARGKIDKAYYSVRNAAKWNGRTLPDNFTLNDVVDNIRKEEERLKMTKANFWDMFRYPVYIVRTLNIYFNWMVNSMVYYGLAYHVSSFAGDLFLNNSISGAVEIPGYIVSVPLLMWGRKRALILSLGLAGVSCCLISAPYPDHLQPLSLLFFFIGRFAVTTSFAVVYCITSDLYPTVIRTTAQASGSMFARFGSIIAPYILIIPNTAELGSHRYQQLKPIPPIIFGIFSLTAAALTFLLPETRGEHMPETLPDGLKDLSRFEKLVHKSSTPISTSKVQPDAANGMDDNNHADSRF